MLLVDRCWTSLPPAMTRCLRQLRQPPTTEAINQRRYEDLEVEYIRGHNPDLVIMDDAGEEIERIDLSTMKTDEIHGLLKEKGFARSEL
ncbi:hypothetical protein CTAYLR_006703 [Chrysophaeum taylorii]|uniref:Selenoprotein F/M domain-containing protein n=1 Tax=Chrysophaeum taylorii TaxID=2483200 RepID=A0AAD7UAV1_9STRA|nr:hypothetical protein CTAYLR_006703 [Chrysophaeum taylorii]